MKAMPAAGAASESEEPPPVRLMPEDSGRKDRPHWAIRRLHRAVRGFRRGNNANNTNLSPLTMNANNSPSNANTNIGFGNCKVKSE